MRNLDRNGRSAITPALTLAMAMATAGLSQTAPAEGVRSASMLANTCAGCHGTDGASAGLYMPSIGGMDKRYLISVLNDYKTSLRPSTIMGRIMRGYSDQEISAIAAYFAGQSWVSTDRIAEAAMVRTGEQVHERACASCHEDGGRAQEDDAPRLAGQWAEYTLYALENCRASGARCKPREMGERVMELSDAELASLAHYYEGQK